MEHEGHLLRPEAPARDWWEVVTEGLQTAYARGMAEAYLNKDVAKRQRTLLARAREEEIKAKSRINGGRKTAQQRGRMGGRPTKWMES